MVGNLNNEVGDLQRNLEGKERYIERLKYESKKLVAYYRKLAAEQKQTFREEKLSLEKKIKIKDEDLLLVEKEMEELTTKKNHLENVVTLKLNVICKRDNEIEEKEQEVADAIEESNRLRLEIDALQQYGKGMVENKDMSKKMEILEDKLAEKENTIMNLRKKNTMTRGEIKEELGKITKGQEKKTG